MLRIKLRGKLRGKLGKASRGKLRGKPGKAWQSWAKAQAKQRKAAPRRAKLRVDAG